MIEKGDHKAVYYICIKNTTVVLMTKMQEEIEMKKSSYVALVLGTVSGVLFSLGMCMALVAEWNMLKEGAIMGGAGLLLGLITLLVWRKMEHKAPIKVSGKTVAKVLYAVIAALVLGVGLCLCLVKADFVLGIVIGLVGIVMLMGLIPMIKGLK